MRAAFALIVLVVAFTRPNTACADGVTLSFALDGATGAAVYPCNAGIVSAAGTGSQLCHLIGSTQGCQSGAADCVCTLSGGDTTHDALVAQLAPWSATAGAGQSFSLRGDIGATRALIADGSEFQSLIVGLSFNLGSERYGTSYWVDMCYRGPQTEYWATDTGLLTTLTAAVMAGGPLGATSNASYVALSGLQAQVTWSCDLQGMGTQRGAVAAGGNPYGIVSLEDLGAPFNSFGSPMGKVDAAGQSAVAQMTTGQSVLIQNLEISQTVASATAATSVPDNAVPRLCKIRTLFTETNAGSLRVPTQNGSALQVYTRILP